MSKKSDFVARVIGEVKPRWPHPAKPKKGLSLLEQGLVLVLMRHVSQSEAETAVDKLREAYASDWNEARVSQAQELCSHFGGSRGGKSWRASAPLANAVRDYLQEVFQITHGLDLEFLRQDQAAAAKWLQQVPYLTMTGAAYLLWVAQEGVVPITPPLSKILDRFELISRTSSVGKAKGQIDPLVPAGKELEFALVFHEIAERWNDPAQPIYEQFAVLRDLPFGRKAHQERQTQLARAEAQRKREVARAEEHERKETQRRERDAARERKRREAEEQKRDKERKRREQIEARKREQAQKKQKRGEELRKKKEEAAKKQAAAKKKALEDKKKAVERAKAAKKAAAAKKKGGKSGKKDSGRKRATTGKKTPRKRR